MSLYRKASIKLCNSAKIAIWLSCRNAKISRIGQMLCTMNEQDCILKYRQDWIHHWKYVVHGGYRLCTTNRPRRDKGQSARQMSMTGTLTAGDLCSLTTDWEMDVFAQNQYVYAKANKGWLRLTPNPSQTRRPCVKRNVHKTVSTQNN